jgi:hypothetical protein
MVSAPLTEGDSVTKQSEAIGSTKQTVSVLGPPWCCDKRDNVVCLFPSLGGRAKQRDWRHANQKTTVPVDVIAATRRKARRQLPKAAKWEETWIAPPHNVSIARHGCAHMRLPFRTALLVARQLRDIEAQQT